jgi:hypothetical protein
MYTAKNIKNIKSMGKLETYISSEQKLIDALSDAPIEYDTKGTGTVSIAHLYGRIGVDTEEYETPHAVAWVVAGNEWSKHWPIKNFNSQDHALEYAKAALENQLKKDAEKIFAEAKTRLEVLKEAR